MFCFSRANHASTNLEKVLNSKLDKFTLFTSAETLQTLEGLGEFSTVMQTLEFGSGLHDCPKFSQPLSCLYQAMQTRKTFSIV